MADFNKPSHTQSSDEIVSALNDKIQAIATLSLNDGTWTNVPVGTVAFDASTNQFKRKTDQNTWSTVQLSLGIESSLTIGTLSANTVTLLGTTPQSITAASYKLLKDDVQFLKSTAIDIVVGSSGTDFNIEVGNAGSGIEGSEDELGLNTIVKTINLPSASETARGAVTTGEQTLAGLKKFSSGKIQIGTDATTTKNWHITTSVNTDSSLRIVNGNDGSGTTRITLLSTGNLGLGVTPTEKLHLDGAIKLDATTSPTWEASSSKIWRENSFGTRYDGTAHRFDVGATRAEALRIDSDGKVGIGTTPETIVDIKKDQASATEIRILNGNTSGSASIRVGTTNTNSLTISKLGNSNNITYNNGASGSHIWQSGGTTRLQLESNGNLGLGITPTQRLHVFGSVQIDGNQILKNVAPTISLLDDSTSANSNSAFFRNAEGTLFLLRGPKNSTTWTQNSSGYWPLEINLNTNAAVLGGNLTVQGKQVGIGGSPAAWNTTATAVTLDVAGNFGLMTLSGHTYLANNTFWNSSNQWIRKSTGTGSLYVMNAAGGHDWYVSSSGAANSQISSWSGSMTLDNSANLTVTGNIFCGHTIRSTFGSNEGPNLTLINTNKNNHGRSWVIMNMTGPYGNGLEFWNYPSVGSGATRLTITDDGDLEVARHLSCNIANCYRVSTSGEGISYPGFSNSFGGLSANNISFAWASPYIYGGVDNVVNAIVGTVSDYRLKQDFSSGFNALNIIKQITPGSYFPKNFDGTISQHPHYGMLAHEVQKIIPSVVVGEKDAVDDKGNPKYQSIHYAGIVPFLIKAIQEQQEKIEDLERRLHSLESKD